MNKASTFSKFKNTTKKYSYRLLHCFIRISKKNRQSLSFMCIIFRDDGEAAACCSAMFKWRVQRTVNEGEQNERIREWEPSMLVGSGENPVRASLGGSSGQ